MRKGNVWHIFFMGETKGSMSAIYLLAIERAKADSAERLFCSLSIVSANSPRCPLVKVS